MIGRTRARGDRPSPWGGSLALALALAIGGCYASHAPPDAGFDEDAGPRVCGAEIRDDCCAIEGCDWYSRHPGCFHRDDRCMSDADCARGQRCDRRTYSSSGSDCGGWGSPGGPVYHAFCVPR